MTLEASTATDSTSADVLPESVNVVAAGVPADVTSSGCDITIVNLRPVASTEAETNLGVGSPVLLVTVWPENDSTRRALPARLSGASVGLT